MPILSKRNFKKYPIILFIMGFFIIISSLLTFSASVFIIQIFLGAITIPLIMNKGYKRAKLYTVIYIVSIFFVFLIFISNSISFGAPYYNGGSDDLVFEEKGKLVFESGIYNPTVLLGTVLDQYDNAPFFIVYLAFLMNFSEIFGGYSTFIPRIINVYFIIWIAMIFESLIIKYGKFSERKANITIAIFALMPNIQYINSHIFRDTFNMFQVFLLAFIVDKLFSPKNFMTKVILGVAFITVLYSIYFTRQNSLVFAGVLILLIFFSKLKIKLIYGLGIIIPFLFLSNFSDRIKLDYFIETYTKYVLLLAGDGLSSFVFAQPLVPFGIGLRAFYAFIVPFPNFFGLFNDTNLLLNDIVFSMIYSGVILQIFFIPFVFKRLVRLDWLVFSFGFFFIGIIATTFTFRHVLMYYPFMVALAVDGFLSTSVKLRKIIIFLMLLLLIMMSFIYLVLKFL